MITVTVSGPQGSGKTALLEVIRYLVEVQHGFDTEISFVPTYGVDRARHVLHTLAPAIELKEVQDV